MKLNSVDSHKNLQLIKTKVIKTNLKLVCPDCDSSNYIKAGFCNRTNGRNKQRYRCKDCRRLFVELDPIKIREILTASDLGLKANPSRSHHPLVFDYIFQPTLRKLARKFIEFRASNREYSTLLDKLKALHKFSTFFEENNPSLDIDSIDRSIIINYLKWLKPQGLSPTTIQHHIGGLKDFLDIANREHWLNLPSYLITSDDYPKETKRVPRYIPEEVMQQLRQHLDALPKSVMRMVLVLEECGLRICELVQLEIDCLRKDSKGNYSIKYTNFKMKRERYKPISSECSLVIKEQQKYIKNNFKDSYSYLFCGREPNGLKDDFKPKPTIMLANSFSEYLNRLADEFNITTISGTKWKFQTHQFRHTVGTRMINNGVPQYIVQKYLDRDSPIMTSVYAHVHDETLRKELAKFHENKTIDITGQVVLLELESNSEDLDWFTKEIAAIALPNGYCGRPKVLGDCDIAGDVGCYLCPFFRTNNTFISVHKDQLERINQVLAKAYKYSWRLPIKKNEPIKQNLELIISTLETDNNEQAQ